MAVTMVTRVTRQAATETVSAVRSRPRQAARTALRGAAYQVTVWDTCPATPAKPKRPLSTPHTSKASRRRLMSSPAGTPASAARRA